MIKLTLIIIILTILVCLFLAAKSMIVHDDNDQSKMVKQLSWRIGLSILCIIIIIGAHAAGYLKPSASLQYLNLDTRHSVIDTNVI